MSSTVWSGLKTFTVSSGAQDVIAIPAPARGTLRGYTLVQLTGAADGFEASLYSSDKTPEEPYHLLNLSNNASVVVDADVVALAENNAVSVAYQNRNGTPSVHERLLYLKITPAGSGDKDFTLSITVETPRL
jgi:hypothetical protein